jgi:hypothetical protein
LGARHVAAHNLRGVRNEGEEEFEEPKVQLRRQPEKERITPDSAGRR